ncbi:MAG: CoA-binding protein [Actinomycetales bacterium]|nr:CoA-binding protein [Actinomycetales bacterium]
MKTSEAAAQFLAHRRIAVTGVARKAAGHGGNPVYLRLRERGYETFAVNPAAQTVEGDPCYPNLAGIPGGVDAVVIATRPDQALATMHEVVDLGIGWVWMHRAFGAGSVSPEAAEFGRAHGVTVIDGGCPLMFGPTADGGHRFMCRVLTMTGVVPRSV